MGGGLRLRVLERHARRPLRRQSPPFSIQPVSGCGASSGNESFRTSRRDLRAMQNADVRGTDLVLLLRAGSMELTALSEKGGGPSDHGILVARERPCGRGGGRMQVSS